LGTIMPTPIITGFQARSRVRSHLPYSTSSRQRQVFSPALPLGLAISLLAVTRPVAAQDAAQSQKQLEPIVVSPPKQQTTTRPGGEPQGAPKRVKRTARNTSAKPASPGPSKPQAVPTPLNSNVVAGSSNLLGLTVFKTQATVKVVSQQTMREQGYRTTPETAAGAVGVLALYVAGAPAGFSMRGFSFGEVTVLYNGIWIGPQSITSRVMDTANLAQVEFVK